MKIPRKSLLVLPFLLCVVGFSISAYAFIYASSNPVEVDLKYDVGLSASVSGSKVTLTAIVTNNGVSVGEGIQVDFFVSADGGVTYYDLAYAYTDAEGSAEVIYNAEYNGHFDFYAMASIP